jgi:hypothetical protein
MSADPELAQCDPAVTDRRYRKRRIRCPNFVDA